MATIFRDRMGLAEAGRAETMLLLRELGEKERREERSVLLVGSEVETREEDAIATKKALLCSPFTCVVSVWSTEEQSTKKKKKKKKKSYR